MDNNKKEIDNKSLKVKDSNNTKVNPIQKKQLPPKSNAPKSSTNANTNTNANKKVVNKQAPVNVPHPNNNALRKVFELVKNSIGNLQNKKDTNEIIKELNSAAALLFRVITDNDKLFQDIRFKFNQLMIQNNNIRNSINDSNITNSININNSNVSNVSNVSNNENLTFGVKNYENGDKYQGFIKDNKKEGRGKYFYKNGNVYEGDFKNDISEGKGVFNFVGGNKYIGDFKDGKANGKGVYIWSNGNKYEGDWKNGKRIGQGVFFWKNGDIEIGNFDEKPIGKFAKLNTLGEILLIKYTED